jgi:hypothetical protein
LRFFFDNQLSPRLAASLGALAGFDGDVVTHLREKFPQNTKDVDWIPKLAEERDWIIICGDLDIVRTRVEQQVWRSAKLVGFFLKKGWMNLPPWEQAWRLVKWWPVIRRQAEIAAPGSTYLVQAQPANKVQTL